MYKAKQKRCSLSLKWRMMWYDEHLTSATLVFSSHCVGGDCWLQWGPSAHSMSQSQGAVITGWRTLGFLFMLYTDGQSPTISGLGPISKKAIRVMVRIVTVILLHSTNSRLKGNSHKLGPISKKSRVLVRIGTMIPLHSTKFRIKGNSLKLQLDKPQKRASFMSKSNSKLTQIPKSFIFFILKLLNFPCFSHLWINHQERVWHRLLYQNSCWYG